MRHSQSIHSLTLEGFQVFDKPTHIPLSKLTFLIGPNSAGKSAVEDGQIELMFLAQVACQVYLCWLVLV
jgi:predicted ATPase